MGLLPFLEDYSSRVYRLTVYRTLVISALSGLNASTLTENGL